MSPWRVHLDRLEAPLVDYIDDHAALGVTVNPLITFGASIVGGAVAAAAALGGIAVRQRGDDARATKADQQRLRDAKADRLRRLYEPFVEFALVLEQTAREKSYVLQGDSVEERDARHQRQLSEGMQKVSPVIAAAVMEPGTAEVRDAYQATYQACSRYLRSLNVNARVANSTTLEELNKEFDDITTAARALEAMVLQQLQELEKAL